MSADARVLVIEREGEIGRRLKSTVEIVDQDREGAGRVRCEAGPPERLSVDGIGETLYIGGGDVGTDRQSSAGETTMDPEGDTTGPMSTVGELGPDVDAARLSLEPQGSAYAETEKRERSAMLAKRLLKYPALRLGRTAERYAGSGEA